MNTRTQVGMPFCCKLAGLVLLIFGTSVSAQLNVMVDPDGDEVYEKIRSYPVSYEEALRAFAEAGGAPWDGTGTILYSANEIRGVSFSAPQSWDGFVAFLDETYPSEMSRLPLCDDTIIGTITWDCDGLSCTPESACEDDQYGPVGFVDNWFCVPGGDPPCPPEKPSCVKTGVSPLIVSFTTDADPLKCWCQGGLGGVCKKNLAASVTGWMFEGDVCECTEPIPTVSEWGLIILTLLGLTAGTIVFGRRRRAAAA